MPPRLFFQILQFCSFSNFVPKIWVTMLPFDQDMSTECTPSDANFQSVRLQRSLWQVGMQNTPMIWCLYPIVNCVTEMSMTDMFIYQWSFKIVKKDCSQIGLSFFQRMFGLSNACVWWTFCCPFCANNWIQFTTHILSIWHDQSCWFWYVSWA